MPAPPASILRGGAGGFACGGRHRPDHGGELGSGDEGVVEDWRRADRSGEVDGRLNACPTNMHPAWWRRRFRLRCAATVPIEEGNWDLLMRVSLKVGVASIEVAK